MADELLSLAFSNDLNNFERAAQKKLRNNPSVKNIYPEII